ncbi:MAG: phosphodiesterase, partial [Spirochaetales bacterium]|nr:phosphodiesterase [Spirochaetales bacterium]
MKIMVISDIHGKAPALKKVLDIYREESFERLLILGDILYHGPRNPLPEGYAPAEVVELLNPLKTEILAARGNCDSEVDQMLLEFPIMGDSAQLQLGTLRLVLTHGHLEAPRVAAPLAGELRLSGHTHIPVLDTVEGVTFFNPGSISLPKGGNPPSYGIIHGDRLGIVNLDSR